MRKILLSTVAFVTIVGMIYILVPGGEDAAQRIDRAKIGDVKETAPVELSGGENTINLSSANTTIGFGCSKTLAGKTLTMRGGWKSAFGSELSGRVIVDQKKQSIRQMELQIVVDSLWSEHDDLTQALLTKGFFQVEKHPEASFISTNIEVDSADGTVAAGSMYRVSGNLSLNGIEKSIEFPAKIEVVESGLKLLSKFSLRCADFDVRFVDSAGFGLLTDENISELVAVDVAIDSTVRAAGDVSNKEESEADQHLPSQPIDFSKLPQTYTETIPSTQIQFEMVLVPGELELGIAPIYVGKHEVTWDEFMPWVDGRDLDDVNSVGELRAMKLRPSSPYGSIDRGFGMDRRPALGMSRLSALEYCRWLSKQTGKNYRLPTEAEWERIYVAGGGSLEKPPDSDKAKSTAVFADASWNDDLEDWATKPVGSTEPNGLGAYDMEGNVCEWVTDTGDERVARGGHFDSDLKDLGVGRHVEGPYWNRDYPNEPKSIWWFVNARWVGFRLVCDLSQ